MTVTAGKGPALGELSRVYDAGLLLRSAAFASSAA
jgi:hypothetical protein